MKNGMRWVLVTIMAVAVMASVLGGASVAVAAENECPQQVGNGVICTGPSIPSDAELPDAELDEADLDATALDSTDLSFQLGEPLEAVKADDSECPIPVGDGVICTGPTLPGGEPLDGQSVTLDKTVFLPVFRS